MKGLEKMKLLIAEKPSVAKAICPVLGAITKKNGYMEGNGYIVSWCFGHLVGMYMPNDYGEPCQTISLQNDFLFQKSN